MQGVRTRGSVTLGPRLEGLEEDEELVIGKF